MPMLAFVIIVMGNEGKVNRSEEAEDHCLYYHGKEFDRQKELAYGYIPCFTELIHRVDGFTPAKDVSVKSQTKGRILHQLGNDLDHEDEDVDRNHRDAHLRTGEVGQVADQSILLDAFILDISNTGDSHAQVETKASGGGKSKKQGDQIAYENDEPKGADKGDVFTTARTNDPHAHVFDEEIELLGQLSQRILKNSLVDPLSRHGQQQKNDAKNKGGVDGDTCERHVDFVLFRRGKNQV